jgi:hypothetical protein
MRARVDAGIISPSDVKLADYPMVFVHGRKPFEWTAAERKALRTYVERGGVVIADSICGNAEFAESFRREWEIILPEGKFARLPKEHPIFSKEFEGFDITQVSYRRPVQGATSELAEGPPVIESNTLATGSVTSWVTRSIGPKISAPTPRTGEAPPSLKSSVISVIAMIRSTPRTRRVRRLSCTAAPRPPAVTGRRVVTGWRWFQRLVSGTST